MKVTRAWNHSRIATKELMTQKVTSKTTWLELHARIRLAILERMVWKKTKNTNVCGRRRRQDGNN